MKHAKVTLEHKKKAVEIALEGGDPLKYLNDHGAGNAPAMWYTIKQHLKEADPEKFSRLPDMRANGNNRKKAETEKADVPTLADAMTGMKDATDEFFGKCEEMGLKVNEREEIRKPVIKPHEIFTVTAIRHKTFGEFYRDFDHHCIDWRTPHGDEVSLEVQAWKAILNDLPEILKRLGVEV